MPQQTQVELNAEQKVWLDGVRAKSAKDRHLEAPPFPGTIGEPIRFYLALRSAIGKIKSAREKAGLTLAEVSMRSGMAEETLCRLETGAASNPTWKTLGDYASAVGVKISISVKPSLSSD